MAPDLQKAGGGCPQERAVVLAEKVRMDQRTVLLVGAEDSRSRLDGLSYSGFRVHEACNSLRRHPAGP